MDIENQITNINVKNPNEVIDFYESNIVYFKNYQGIVNHDKICKFIEVKLYYANSLFDKHYLDKTSEILEEAKELLNKLPSNQKQYIDCHRDVRFLSAIILSKRKQYKEAFKIFKQLHKEDTNHHYYKLWYLHTKLNLFNWFFNSFLVIGVILILIDWIFFGKEKFIIDLGITGVIFLAIAFFAPMILKKLIKLPKQ